MSEQEQKVIQYLNEAHATELALIQTLQAHIAMTPSGGYRTGLERHLRETNEHAERVERRLGDLGQSRNRLLAGVGAVQGLLGQVLALSKGPIDLVRGGSGEEKLLKNAKDECATEALEIATYTALGRLAEIVGDDETAKLAASIRGQEQRMLDRLLSEIPKLTEAVVRSEIEGRPSFDASTTGAADAVREAGDAVRETAQKANRRGRSAARQARKVPGVARAEGQVKGAAASEEDLPIANYKDLKVDDVIGRLTDLSQIDLAKIDAYERKFQNRRTIVNKIDTLQGDEPWPGYDEQSVEEITTALAAADDQRLGEVRNYERRHKDRAGVLRATERESSRS